MVVAFIQVVGEVLMGEKISSTLFICPVFGKSVLTNSFKDAVRSLIN